MQVHQVSQLGESVRRPVTQMDLRSLPKVGQARTKLPQTCMRVPPTLQALNRPTWVQSGSSKGVVSPFQNSTMPYQAVHAHELGRCAEDCTKGTGSARPTYGRPT